MPKTLQACRNNEQMRNCVERNLSQLAIWPYRLYVGESQFYMSMAFLIDLVLQVEPGCAAVLIIQHCSL